MGVALSVDTTSLSESASATEVTVTATLDEGDTLDSDTEIDHRSLGGDSNVAATTISLRTDLSVTIEAGESSGSGALTITPTDDDVVEGDETITVSGSATGIAISSAEMTLTDNDSATLKVSGPSAAVAEGSNAEFTVTLSHDVAADVTVALSAASGSATAGSDFGAAPATVTFDADSGANARQFVNVAVTNDNISENAEDFSVSLGEITGDLASLVSLKPGEEQRKRDHRRKRPDHREPVRSRHR